MRAKVDLPTATEPATPITYGTFGDARTEERRGDPLEILHRAHVQIQESAERQVDRTDLIEVDPFVDALERFEVVLPKCQGRRGTQRSPIVTFERQKPS